MVFSTDTVISHVIGHVISHVTYVSPADFPATLTLCPTSCRRLSGCGVQMFMVFSEASVDGQVISHVMCHVMYCVTYFSCRFSSDVDIMDNKLPESFRLWTIMVFSSAAIIVVVSVTTPIFIAAIVPIAIFYAFCVVSYGLLFQKCMRSAL